MSRFNETMYAAFAENNVIPPAYFDKYNVKRGLRNPDGTGVMFTAMSWTTASADPPRAS